MQHDRQSYQRGRIDANFTALVCRATGLAGALALVAAGGAAQVVQLPQEAVLYGDDPAISGFPFGERIDAQGKLAVSSGTMPNGSQHFTVFERLDDGTWTRTTVANSQITTPGSPVAVNGGRAYRSEVDPLGFRLMRKLLQGSVSQPWESVWNPGASSAQLYGLDAATNTLGDFAVGAVVALGYTRVAAGSNLPVTDFVVLKGGSSGTLPTLFSSSFAFGGIPSVSADDRQAALGLRDLGQVLVAVDESDDSWAQEEVIVAPAGAGDFGAAVALRGNWLAVGAPTTQVCVVPPSTGCSNTGQVYIYQRTAAPNIWELHGTLISGFNGVPDGAALGSSVAFSPTGQRLAAGAPGWLNPNRGGPTSEGSVMLASNTPSGWRVNAQPVTIPPQANRLGASVVFAGDDLLAGAPQHASVFSTVGAVLVFREFIFADGFEIGTVGKWSAAVP